MNLNDIIKVHIWQLPEKNNEINKPNEYTIIHDKYTLKKVKISKLYEYFTQDYKINNVVKYFENMLQSIDNEYNEKYSLLELSIDEYEKIVEDLAEKFNKNKEDILDFEVRSKKVELSIKDFKESFNDINNKISILDSTLDSFNSVISKLQSEFIGMYNNIIILQNRIKDMQNTASNLYSNSEKMNNKIHDIKNSIDTDVDTKKLQLIQNINSEYDKILAIIDYYHHIHESDNI